MKFNLKSQLFIILSIFCLSINASEKITKDWNKLFWIWNSDQGQATIQVSPGKCYFRHCIDIKEPPFIEDIFIQVAVDNSCKVYMNGRQCGSADSWNSVRKISLKEGLRTGHNCIAIEALNDGPEKSPAGLLGKITIHYKNGKKSKSIPIDKNWKTSIAFEQGWQSSDFDDSKWADSERICAFGGGPWSSISPYHSSVPEEFPKFIIPENQELAETMREIFYMFYSNGTGGTLWDPWIHKSVLWAGGEASDIIRKNSAKMLATRIIDEEGYVSSHQHKGLAHNYGWPFPLWTQAGGVGWMFSIIGLPYGSEFGIYPTESIDGWELDKIKSIGINSKQGLKLELQSGNSAFSTSDFYIDSFISPFICLEWEVLQETNVKTAYIEWTTKTMPSFSKDRRMYFPVPKKSNRLESTMIPVHKSSLWNGRITRLRLCFQSSKPVNINIKKLFTAIDSRHNINNFCYIQGCADYLKWTKDRTFLRNNIQKMRLALRYALNEFQVEKYKCVNTTWVGHDGQNGISKDSNGKTVVLHGRGIGNNYWDLLPFGGKDPIATMYCYDALKAMASLERAVIENPQWNIPAGPMVFDPEKLNSLSEQVKQKSNQIFWNNDTNRLVSSVNPSGGTFDYGFTFLNLEGIYYGLLTDKHSRCVMDWVSGKRIIAGDTSTGDDIYYWRFAPRSTTKRNLDYYGFIWPIADQMAWGDQVQDGGAVFGFSYFDLMSRLKVYGADNALDRLEVIAKWYKEVQSEGGFRAYYSKPDRGTLQGGGTAGGLGIDKEFTESVLMPQVMLYGFLGFNPTMEGFSINPKLPKKWSKLTITNIKLHKHIFDITCSNDAIVIDNKGQAGDVLKVFLPEGKWNIKHYDKQNDLKEEFSHRAGKFLRDEVVLKVGEYKKIKIVK